MILYAQGGGCEECNFVYEFFMLSTFKYDWPLSTRMIRGHAEKGEKPQIRKKFITKKWETMDDKKIGNPRNFMIAVFNLSGSLER